MKRVFKRSNNLRKRIRKLEQQVSERDASPFNFEEYACMELNEVEKQLIAEVLKPLKKCSLAGAISVLDKAKDILPYCTRLHSKYT